MAKANKRNDGRYQKHFRFEGKQYTVYGINKTDAEEKKLEKIQQLRLGLERQHNPILNDYYEKCFTEFRMGKVKEATIRHQKIQFKKCADVVINDNGTKFGEMNIANITPKDVKAVQKKLEQSKLSTQSVNDYMAHLSHVFSNAIKDETINRNPCQCLERIRRTETPASETKHRALTKEETALFFQEAVESYFYNNFCLMIQTGMRIGEISALKHSDIDTKNNCIHVTKTITRNEDGTHIVGTSTKTYAGARDIPMNDTILKIIKDQKSLNKSIFGNVTSIDDLLFRSTDGKILKEYQVNRAIKRINKKTGIEHFTCHAFRSTFATRFIEQRPQDFKVLSEILGHADTKITLNLYTHVMNETKKNAMENIIIAL